MRDYFKLRKSKLLLLALLTMIGGVSSALSQTPITEEFISTTNDWPNDWSISEVATSEDYFVEYDSSNDYSYPSGRRGVYGQVASGTTKYIITPVVNGSGSFKFKRRNSSNGSVYVYTYDNGVLSSSPIASNTLKPTSFTTVSFSDVDNMRLAIVLNGRMDDFTYTPGIEASCKSPKNLAVSDVTDESATISWDAGEANTWNLKYKSASDADFTEVNNLSSNSYDLTGLDAATTYTVQVQTVCSTEDQSSWASVVFTTPLCSPSAQKTISYEFTDKYSDGWNGAKITITDVITGVEIATLTLSSGGSSSGTVALCPDREYSFTWTKGNYDSECGYTIKDVDGNNLFTLAQSSSPAAGEIGKYKWENTPAVDGAKFAINTDGTTQNLGVAVVNASSTPKEFTITNNGNADLFVNVTNAADFFVQKVIRFSNSKGWSNVYLHAWNEDGDLDAGWPGIQQTTIVGQNEYNQDIYAIEIPVGTTKIILHNNSGAQSSDIVMDYTKLGLYLDDSNNGVFFGDGYLSVPAGGSTDIKVVMKSTTSGIKSGNIELAFTAVNGTEFTIPVTGTVLSAGAEVVDFNTAIPSTWENQDNGWSIYNNEAAKCTGKKNLTTQKLDFSSEENPFFLMMVKASDSGSGDYITVEGSTDNGTTWTAFDKKTYSYPTDFGASTADYSAIIVSIPNTVNKLRFNGYYVLIDQIVGLKYSDNDPRMGIYANAECTVAATTAENKEFGFVTDAPAAITYYIKNDGTGTMNLTLADNVTGMTAALGATALTAGQSTTLTITKDATKGFFGGDAVVTAEGLGTFNVSVSGVLVDENKFDIDFTSKDIPAAWTNSNWSKNSNGYIETSYSMTSLESTTLTATAGEKLVVMAKNSYTGSSYTFGVKYKKVGDENWSDLIAEENQGTSWKMLVGTIAEAGDYLLQFNGKYAQIQRIYGLSKPDAPEMVVYDGNAVAGASHSFGKVTDENDATWTLTVKNEGEATLTGLAVALTGDNADHYTATIEGNKTELAKNETATITVTQLKDNLGTHSATLTISATGLDSKEITLSGQTIDHTVLDVDFDTSSDWPSEIIQHGANWSVYYSSYSNSGWAQQTSSSTVSSLILTPLTINASTDKLKFGAWKYSSSGSYHNLAVRYTTDGGVTWTDYDWNNYTWSADETLRQQLTSSEKEFEITGIPAGTVAFDFYGKYVRLDNITGDMKVATAPLVTFTTVENNISGANLKADATATYTLANNGNADYVATVGTTNVTAEVTGDDVTFEAGTLTVPAGKTASITVTMAFAAPYGEKTGNLSITSTSWVGDITDNYTATLVDPTNFVEDFAANARPAGWYKDNNWYFNNGSAYINAGTAKPLITEKIEAEASTNRNVLSFDAKKYYDYDTNAATLSVYTSADRKDWTLRKECTLDNDDNFVTFTLDALADGEYYVKFEGTNARLDNIMGVKKILPAPEHDLFLVSATLPTDEITPNTNYGATLNVASLRASEVVAAELYFGDTKVTELTGQTINSGATLTFQLTGKTPAAGTYDVYAKVYNAEASVETDHVSVTVADTRKLHISAFPNATAVQADDNNEFTATFNVTVENTGTASLDASDVSVSLIDNADANNVFTATWSAATSNVLYMNTEKDGTDIATGCTLKAWCWNTAEDGVWATFTNINPGFWSLDLNGKTNFKICRYNDAGTDADPWNNVWNASGDLSLTNGNLVKFTGYNGEDMNFSSDNMAYLEPTMTTTLKVTVTGTLADGENASFAFKAKENVSDTYYGSGLTSNVSVTAAPTIVLDETDGTVASTGQNRKVTLNRTFVAGWNTICLPFAIEATDIHAEAKALAFTAYDTNTKELTFSPVTELEANKPYVIWVENAITEPIEFTGKTVTTSDDPETAFNGVTFQGTYTSMAAGSLSGMWGLTASGKIAKAGASTTMKGFRAYFDGIPATGATARFLDDESTGISSITIDGSAEGVYNLQGQKVEQLHKGGLYIINGKKVVIK